MSEILKKECVGGILVLTLNRPEKFNALNNALVEQIHDSLIEFSQDDSLRVAVINGSGKNFCSGADIKQFGDNEAQTPEAIERRAEITMGIQRMASVISKPIISSVRGYALAGGCGLALAADMVVASENAVFGYPEIRRGFVPALVLVNLSRILGRHRALELLLTGKKISAAQALEWGMINMTVPDDKLEQRTMELAEELEKISPSAMAYTKKLYYTTAELELDEALQEAKTINEAMRKSNDFSAGVKRFASGEKA